MGAACSSAVRSSWFGGTGATFAIAGGLLHGEGIGGRACDCAIWRSCFVWLCCGVRVVVFDLIPTQVLRRRPAGPQLIIVNVQAA